MRIVTSFWACCAAMLAVIVAAVALGYRALTGDEYIAHIIGVGAILIAGFAFVLVEWERKGWLPRVTNMAEPEQRLTLIGAVLFMLSFGILVAMGVFDWDGNLILPVWIFLLTAGFLLLWFYPIKRLLIRMNQWIRRRT